MRRWLSTIALLAAVSLCGCAGMGDSVSAFLAAGPWWKAAQADDIRARAVDLEARGELAMALDHWRQVREITFDRQQANGEIVRLEHAIAAAVQSHYQAGVAALGRKNRQAARNHFLAALRLDPGFEAALQQIKAHFSTFPLTAYLSVPGDRPASVAEKVLGDKNKAFLVTWFNDLPPDATLQPGTWLILPQAEPRKAPQKQPPDRLAKARARLAQNDFDGALTLASQADPAQREVQALILTIHLKQAAARIASGLLADARQSLTAVPDGSAGKAAVWAELQAALQERQIGIDLENARTQFDQGHYRRSLDLAESVLQKAPDLADARDLTAESRYRLALDHVDRQQFLKAREVLEQADEKHQASLTLKQTVRTRLFQQAQIHYRNGVKHFINEDLQAAIAEWEMALRCDPQLEKARENIDNARRIMKKFEKMP